MTNPCKPGRQQTRLLCKSISPLATYLCNLWNYELNGYRTLTLREKALPNTPNSTRDSAEALSECQGASSCPQTLEVLASQERVRWDLWEWARYLYLLSSQSDSDTQQGLRTSDTSISAFLSTMSAFSHIFLKSIFIESSAKFCLYIYFFFFFWHIGITQLALFLFFSQWTKITCPNFG